ncbi:hypothetical protein, partial [Pseudomonas putida]|uniref:hypothetical protein n=1 Tax=Pseudomonas putida TaxID=303 RepID=UPI002118BFDE
VPMLYGRQEILLPECPDGQPSESGYVMFVVLRIFGSFVFTAVICVADCLGVIWSSLTGN